MPKHRLNFRSLSFRHGRIAITAGTDIALIGPRGTGSEWCLSTRCQPSRPSPHSRHWTDETCSRPPERLRLVWLDRVARRSTALPFPGLDSPPHVLALLADADALWAGAPKVCGWWSVGPTALHRPGGWVSRRFELRDVWEIAKGQGDTRWVGTVKGLVSSELVIGPTDTCSAGEPRGRSHGGFAHQISPAPIVRGACGSVRIARGCSSSISPRARRTRREPCSISLPNCRTAPSTASWKMCAAPSG